MIPTHSLTRISGSDFVELIWTSPQYQPERYSMNYLCIILKGSFPNCSIADFVSARMRNLSSDSTSIRIRDLHSNTICVLNLVALFNPASIDPGIVIALKTLAENACKSIPWWQFVTTSYPCNSQLVLAFTILKNVCRWKFPFLVFSKYIQCMYYTTCRFKLIAFNQLKSTLNLFEIKTIRFRNKTLLFINYLFKE